MSHGVDMRARRLVALWFGTLALLAALACGASLETSPASTTYVRCGNEWCHPNTEVCNRWSRPKEPYCAAADADTIGKARAKPDRPR